MYFISPITGRLWLAPCLLFLLSSSYCLGITQRYEKQVLSSDKPISEQISRPGVYVVSSDFDLGGRELRIPTGCVLEFQGGRLLNGLVVGGKMPSKYHYKPEFFGAGMTKDDTYAIQSCLNICHIIDMDGIYHVSNVLGNLDNQILIVPSETSIFLSGSIFLSPVNEPIYSVFSINNANDVSIKGRGALVGDNGSTTISTGEHGMGISITGQSTGIIIDSITVSDCYGDAIYIGADVINNSYREPSDIVIRNCVLHNCRRQGISIVIGHNIEINNCIIYNINGTAPGAAIDIEPQYKGFPVHNVRIRNSVFNNCTMALYCGGAGISSRNLFVSGCSSDSGVIEWQHGENTSFTNCVFRSSLYVDNIRIKNSTINSLFYKGDNKGISKKPNIFVVNSRFRIVGCVTPTGYVKLKNCIIDYPMDDVMLNGSPLRGGYLELINCKCSGLGANYRIPPDVLNMKAKRTSFHYNKAVCLQGDILDLKKCVIKGNNTEEDNALVYARKSGSRMNGCKIYYLNSTSNKPIWVIRGGEDNGFEVRNTEVYSHNPKVLSTKNITPKSIRFNKISQIPKN